MVVVEKILVLWGPNGKKRIQGNSHKPKGYVYSVICLIPWDSSPFFNHQFGRICLGISKHHGLPQIQQVIFSRLCMSALFVCSLPRYTTQLRTECFSQTLLCTNLRVREFQSLGWLDLIFFGG